MPTIEQLGDVVQRMKRYPHPWWVAGGFAIELFLGRSIREHGDLEIGILREHQGALRKCSPGDWEKVVTVNDKGQWVRWEASEWLELPVFQLKTVLSGSDWETEFFLDEAPDGMWRFRRKDTITRPLNKLITHTRDGVPYLAAEVQLLYKAKQHRAKDELDFEQARGAMSYEQRAWLREALVEWNATDPWIARLKE